MSTLNPALRLVPTLGDVAGNKTFTGLFSGVKYVPDVNQAIFIGETRDLLPLLQSGWQAATVPTNPQTPGGLPPVPVMFTISPPLRLTNPAGITGVGVRTGLVTRTQYTPDGSGAIFIGDSRDLLPLLIEGWQ
jgi:hypothetical protein